MEKMCIWFFLYIGLVKCVFVVFILMGFGVVVLGCMINFVMG